MIPEIGHLALIMALGMALIQGFIPLLGSALNNAGWIAVAKPAARGQFLFVAISFVCLTYTFIVNDFSVVYVASNSNSALPLIYRISAVWGAHEGSLLLWALILSGWTLAVAQFSRGLPEILAARALAVLGLISIGFILFMLFTSNPFDRLIPAAADGRDLNPLLQDPGLIIHPPMLYMGYVGFAVPFAIAIGGLLGGRLDAAWARWSRPWTTAAWVFLTLGITLGSWWAYYELGWGGWWFWDPVENASFMPWLVGTALIHSLAVTEKRGTLKTWTVLLAILAFSLSLLGTFLVRSGVLVSVHAFATDPARGLFILIFLAVVIGASLVLYAWRAPAISGGASFGLISREGLLLANNVLLAVAMTTVLLGTLYPLILDALNLGKISVGPPYFDNVFVPLMVPTIFLAGIGPLARWKQSTPGELALRLRYTLIAAIAAGVILPLALMGSSTIMVSLGIGLAIWLVLATLQDLWSKLAKRKQKLAGLRKLSLSYYGMVLAHIGLGIIVIGVTFSSAYSVEKDVRMEAGGKTEIGGYEFRMDSLQQVAGPNYDASEATVSIYHQGEAIAVLHPQKRIYRVQTMPMTEAGIDATLSRDLFVALGEPLGEGAWSVRLYYKPFQRWIWLGPLFMALGGFLAAADKRYRLVVSRRRVSWSSKLATEGSAG